MSAATNWAGPSVVAAFNGAPLTLDARRRARLRVPAGPHRVTVALVDERRCSGVKELYAGEVEVPGAVLGLVIDGPYAATGAGDTPSRREIFRDCYPDTAAEESACARQLLTRPTTRSS